MNSGTGTKIRMVRCPKCLQILLELPDVPVYECGGCGTRLQAKFYKNSSKSTSLREKEAAQTNDLGTNPGESSDAAILQSEGEHSLDQNNERSHSKLVDCNEDLNGVSLSNGDKTNDADKKSESGNFEAEKHEGSTLLNEDETSGSAGNEVGISNDEQVGCINISDDTGNDQGASADGDVELSRLSNGAQTQHKPEDCTDELAENVNSSSEDQNHGEEQSKSLDCYKILNPNQSGDSSNEPVGGVNCDGEQIQGTDLSSVYQSIASDESSEGNIEQHEIPDEVCLSRNLAIIENEMLSPSEGANSEVEVNGEREKDANADKQNDTNFRRSSTEKLHDERGSNTTLNVCTPEVEGLESCPDEELEQPQVIGHHGFGHGRSTDTFETVDLIDPSSEMSETLIDLSKSPTTSSARAYYGGFVSSCEGTDDLLPDRNKRSSRHVHRPEISVALDERSRKEKFSVNRSSNVLHQIRNSIPLPNGKSSYPRKSDKLDQIGLTKLTRPDHQVQNQRRFETNDWPYKLPFEERGILAGYGNENPDDQLQNEFHSNSIFQSHDNPADSNLEKMKLLRMIYELQDEISKTRILNEQANGRLSSRVTWKDHLGPPYDDHQSLGGELFDDLNFPQYAGRFKDGNNWPKQIKYPRIPYSAEATINRPQADHLLCCCPREWQGSSQLPAAGPHHSQGSCKIHSRINLHSSCPSSPQQHMDTEFSMYSRGTKSDDQRQRDHELLRKYSKEKYHPAKRHLRPLAGGAPFLTCYRCFGELQLPADFLLFKRRYHRLRCGACSTVLKFSLLNRTHLVPYTPTIEAPPPSEVDEYREALRRRNLNSTSPVDPVSFSEDYGLSYSKSYSTEEDPAYRTSLRAVQSNAGEGNYVRPEHREDIKNALLNAGKNKVKNPAKTHKPSDPSSSKTVSSEIEEPTAAEGGSPLHRLMGYSSPSQVIRG